MFVGHLAVALGAKRIEPRLPLAALTLAAFGLDVLWPAFLLAGLETVRIHPGDTAFTPLEFTSYPWSHSLAMSLVWAAIAGDLVARWLKSTRAGLVVSVLVVSHWVLDYVTHRPDLPLWPGGPVEGLGLWNSIAGTIAVEGALFVAGVALYLGATRATDRQGVWAFWLLIAVVTSIWITGPISPPPPSPMALAIVAFTISPVMFLWARWIDRHRGNQ